MSSECENGAVIVKNLIEIKIPFLLFSLYLQRIFSNAELG